MGARGLMSVEAGGHDDSVLVGQITLQFAAAFGVNRFTSLFETEDEGHHSASNPVEQVEIKPDIVQHR
jgi:hypothetical protein